MFTTHARSLKRIGVVAAAAASTAVGTCLSYAQTGWASSEPAEKPAAGDAGDADAQDDAVRTWEVAIYLDPESKARLGSAFGIDVGAVQSKLIIDCGVGEPTEEQYDALKDHVGKSVTVRVVAEAEDDDARVVSLQFVPSFRGKSRRSAFSFLSLAFVIRPLIVLVSSRHLVLVARR